MPVPRSELTDELYHGPLAASLASLLATAQDEAAAALLNDPTGPAAGLAGVAGLDRDAFLVALSPALVALPGKDAATQSKWQLRLQFLQALGPTAVLASGHPVVQGVLADAVADGLLTQQVVGSVFRKQGSRAEVRWGGGTVIDAHEVSQAR